MENKNIPNVLLLFGEENFLIESHLKNIIKSLKQNGIDKNSIEKYDGKEITENVIVDYSSNLSLISTQKIIIVNNFDKLYRNKRKSSKSFTNYIKNPNPDTYLILLGAPGRLNGLSKDLNNSRKKEVALKKVDKLPEVLKYLIINNYFKEFPKVYDNQIPQWIINHTKKLNYTISPNAANLLSVAVDDDLREINQQLKKIIVFKGEDSDNNIDISDVEKIVGINRSNNVFELNNMVGRKDLKTSMKIVDNLMSQGDQSVKIISTLTRYFIILWKLIEERSKTSNKFQLAGRVGVSPFFIDEYSRALNYFHKNEFNKIFNSLAEIDEKLKSTSLDKKYLIQELLVDIINKE